MLHLPANLIWLESARWQASANLGAHRAEAEEVVVLQWMLSDDMIVV